MLIDKKAVFGNFGSLPIGAFFLYENYIFLKTHMEYSKYNAMDLEELVPHVFGDGTLVIPVDVTISLKPLK